MLQQGFEKRCTSSREEDYLMIENKKGITFEWIGTIRLLLDTGFRLALTDTTFVPCMRSCLILFPRLKKTGVLLIICNGSFLWCLSLLFVMVPWLMINKNWMWKNSHYIWYFGTYALWDKRSDHISVDITKILMKERFLPILSESW